VARLRFSRRAETDLYNIGLYTVRTWGEAQTNRYISELEDCCRTIADKPALGRPCDEIRPGPRRMEQGKHVVFYREEPGGVLISRILHQRMLPEKQPIDDEDDT
jgi:toxin ParE1/3/4